MSNHFANFFEIWCKRIFIHINLQTIVVVNLFCHDHQQIPKTIFHENSGWPTHPNVHSWSTVCNGFTRDGR